MLSEKAPKSFVFEDVALPIEDENCPKFDDVMLLLVAGDGN